MNEAAGKRPYNSVNPKHRIGYNEDTKNPHANKSAGNMEEMDISSTEHQVL